MVVFGGALAGCAHSGSGAPQLSVKPSGDTLSAAGSSVEWVGRFKPTRGESRAGTSNDGNGGFMVSGPVRLTVINTQITHVDMTVSGPSDQNGELSWAIVPGECRSGAVPLAPIATFSPIRLSNGRGEMDFDVPVPLPESGTIHVNIYTGGDDREINVLSCAELRMERHAK